MANEKEFSAIMTFLTFSWNYDSSLRWIHEIWDEDGIGDHLVRKFNSCYNTEGSSGVMLAFMAELSLGNQRKLVDWVMENWK